GASAAVDVAVVPPRSDAGAHAEIPILVRMNELEPGPDSSPHMHVVGALTILARVTNGPGSLSLRVPSASEVGARFKVSGSTAPSAANSPISVEYRSPKGGTTTHIVRTGSK